MFVINESSALFFIILDNANSPVKLLSVIELIKIPLKPSVLLTILDEGFIIGLTERPLTPTGKVPLKLSILGILILLFISGVSVLILGILVLGILILLFTFEVVLLILVLILGILVLGILVLGILV